MAALWADFAHHLQRIWRLAVELLSSEHAPAVRQDCLDRVDAAEKDWTESDHLANEPFFRKFAALLKLDESDVATSVETNGEIPDPV